MEAITVSFMWIDEEQSADLKLPGYTTDLAAGMDVGAAVLEPVVLGPGEIQLIPCGFAVAIPEGYEIQVRPRSGLAIKHGVTVINGPGTIDADYRGEVKVGLVNLGQAPYTIHRGDRIAQLVLAPVVRMVLLAVPELAQTARGTGGFGHTGVSGKSGSLPT